MHIGFTGTRDGMTARQYLRLSDWLIEGPPLSGPAWPRIVAVHHGGCIGADAEFQLAVMRGRVGCGTDRMWAEIHIHQSTLADLADAGSLELADVRHGPKPPLERNKDIVAACDLLFATPKTNTEEQRSGTWATIRHAAATDTPLVIIWPDGRFDEHPKPRRPYEIVNQRWTPPVPRKATAK